MTCPTCNSDDTTNGECFQCRYLEVKHETACFNCGQVHTFYTQEDNGAEYMCNVALLCSCGKMVIITTPVN